MIVDDSLFPFDRVHDSFFLIFNTTGNIILHYYITYKRHLQYNALRSNSHNITLKLHNNTIILYKALLKTVNYRIKLKISKIKV